MNRKIYLISLTILPLLAGCKNEEIKGNFYIGNYENSIIELTESELSTKVNVGKDTFFLATHQGEVCECWTGFQYVMQQYNNKRTNGTYIPFYGFDTELLTSGNNYGIDKVTSGYLEFYVIIDGKVEKKYSKSATIDSEMFENTDKFESTIGKYINSNPIKNYSYISYERACNLINDITKEFVLFTIRSGCGDCSYSMPNVLTPWLIENGTKIPVYVCDIEKFRGTSEYDTVKGSLNLTSTASETFGYGQGVVPTYQYYKNGVLSDAGVYANDSFTLEDGNYKVKSYFDGTRNLTFTNKNLKAEMEASSELSSQLAQVGNNIYLSTEKEAIYHDSIFKQFLSYYCK